MMIKMKYLFYGWKESLIVSIGAIAFIYGTLQLIKLLE